MILEVLKKQYNFNKNVLEDVPKRFTAITTVLII